ncbi:type I restriction enzyme S subunit [Metamycoplasma subdolum]|uniref:Type I restriction enzyme S subunit n=1 Tax=Metamycoplasma subdolum TaxID=92407 RepID=A0A3M0A0G6_9BACT|nr:restriction endonuclease subunit S [Metamycoplasma subdolum]RMA78621.1 type I restriction enzyme S subunit [Metamycoplasma subdolum]WPB50777.1 restriction endonuclease subunit S [Metamycoplasma subdolum]
MIEKIEQNFKKIESLALHFFNKYESELTQQFQNCFSFLSGKAFKSDHFVKKSPNKLITIKNISDLGFDTESTSYICNKNKDIKYLLNPGDILLTMTGNIGRHGIVDEENCYLNQRVLKINSISKLYIYCYLIKYKPKIISLGKGTAQKNLSIKDLNTLLVYNSLDEITTFKKYEKLFELMLNQRKKIKKLKKIKMILLEKYFY